MLKIPFESRGIKLHEGENESYVLQLSDFTHLAITKLEKFRFSNTMITNRSQHYNTLITRIYHRQTLCSGNPLVTLPGRQVTLPV